jgi:hypothetical protein
MKRILSVKLDSNIYSQLESMAIKKGVSKSFLVRKQIESLFSAPEQNYEMTILHNITMALQNNRPLSFKVNWDKIEDELAHSEPQWSTADEAMNYVRNRKESDESIH